MTKVLVSCDASKLVKNYLKEHFEVIDFKGHTTYDAVKNHPDLFMFFDEVLFTEKSIDLKGIPQVVGEAIGEKYPENVKYNIAKVGSHVICNEKTTAELLKRHLKNKDYTIIPVKQGYAKCSTLVIDDHSIITSDQGIYKAVIKAGLDACLIRPGFINLPGLDAGFIGGCAFRFNEIVFFSGDISKHPDYDVIKKFIDQRNLTIEYTEEPLVDLGSFILIESVEK